MSSQIHATERCPECGGALDLVIGGRMSELHEAHPITPDGRHFIRGAAPVVSRIERQATYALCSGCEFGLEVTS